MIQIRCVHIGKSQRIKRRYYFAAILPCRLHRALFIQWSMMENHSKSSTERGITMHLCNIIKYSNIIELKKWMQHVKL